MDVNDVKDDKKERHKLRRTVELREPWTELEKALAERPKKTSKDPLEEAATRGRSFTQEMHIGSNMKPDEVEFALALDNYKRVYQRRFPTASEVLAVLKYLGYRKAK